MARRRGWRRRRNRRLAVGGAVLLVAAVVFWAQVWPYLLAAAVLSGLVAGAWRGTHRLREIRRAEAVFQEEQRIRESNRTLEEVDRLSGQDFEKLVAELLREGGCTGVRRVGGSGDRGVDVTGVLPDGRSAVVQCKRYAPNRSVGSGDMQRLLGALTDSGADVALLVTVTRFTGAAERYAKDNGIVAIGRNLFAGWLNGAPLESVLQTSGGGQGNRRHLATWQRTYGTPRQRRRPKAGS